MNSLSVKRKIKRKRTRATLLKSRSKNLWPILFLIMIRDRGLLVRRTPRRRRGKLPLKSLSRLRNWSRRLIRNQKMIWARAIPGAKRTRRKTRTCLSKSLMKR